MTQLATRRVRSIARINVQRAARDGSDSGPASPIVKPVMIFAAAIWLGLATGLGELCLLFCRRHLWHSPELGALELNQHALWMVPVSDTLVLAACGALVAGLIRLFPARSVAVLGAFGLSFLSATAMLFVCRGLTSLAACALSAGIALWATPLFVALAKGRGRIVRRSLPRLIGLVAVLFGLHIGREELGKLRLPAANPAAPNVLLIVLDTVRAKSLSLYGYARPTSPHLAELAARGARFEHARPAAAWTLPSHASLFTGRWAYELSTRLDRPLDGAFPTLAEYLKDHGYDTAGFVANTIFCTTWFGLDRGFLHYEDVAIAPLEVLRSSELGRSLTRMFFPWTCRRDRPRAHFNRKDATAINRDFLSWLSRRPTDRPFFAFLNYYDAHDPYLTPAEWRHRFDLVPRNAAEIQTLRNWLHTDKPGLPPHMLALARDCYDDCIAYLDEQLGRLFAQLDSRGLLENTLVIVTADHGELLGEHQRFGHGQSLYREVADVPLLVLAPDHELAGRVIAAPVSLRDIPATVVDLVGLARTSPFPGRSLARHWSTATASVALANDVILTETCDEAGVVTEREEPARALVAFGKTYIRGKDGREEIYDIAADPDESHDLTNLRQSQALLARFREAMHRIDDEALAHTGPRSPLRQ